MYLLGIDLGTTGCKSMVFDLEGNILGSHYIESELIFTADGVEQDADLWWDNIKSAIKLTLKDACIDGRKILGLSVSSQGISFVPVDKNGKTLMNAVSWYDTRADEEANLFEKDYGSFEVFSRTGRRCGSLVFPQVMWLKKNKPDIYCKTYKFMMGMEFLLYRLCGKCITDYSMASGTLCFDTVEHRWILEYFEKYDIDIKKFPPISCFAKNIGTVKREVAEELGLPENTIVAVGMQDQKTAAIAAGIEDGIITVSMGTASAVSSLTNRHIADKSMKVACHGFDEERWILENVVSTTGAAYKWVKNTMFPKISYDEMADIADNTPIGSNEVMFYPLLYNKKGIRKRGALCGLGLDTTKADIIRAVMEGIAYEIKICIKEHKLLNDSVKNSKELRIFGGGAASELWCRIIADITAMSVMIPRTHETGNLGAAICAGIAAGVFKDLSYAGKLVGEAGAVYKPKEENVKKYKDSFNEYIKKRETV